MKTITGFLNRILDGISNPKLRIPLMILAPCLALVLAVLLLIPVFRGGGDRAPAPTAAPFAAPAPETLPTDPPEAIPVELAEPEERNDGWQTVDGKRFFVLEDGSYAVGLQEIDGRLYYFNQHGEKARALGIDVSFYDGAIDWNAVKAQGIEFAIIRVGGRGWTSGAIYDDSRTQEYLRGARAAGVKIGVYFYSTAIDPREAVEEANMTLRVLDGIPLDYPIFIDMEFSGEYPKGRSDQLSPSQRADIVIAFCETVQNSGYRAGVYASQNYLKAYIDYHSVDQYTVWLASYTANNKLPRFYERYDIWQFSDRGRVNGIRSDVDMNAIYENP